MSIEQRLSRLEVKTPAEDDPHIWYARSDDDAEAHSNQELSVGERPGLYFVTHNPAQAPAMIDGGSLRDELERAARSGKKIHDKPDPNEPPRPESRATRWDPPDWFRRR